MPLSEHISTQCVMDTDLISSVPSQAECSDKKEGKVCLVETNTVPDCINGVSLEKQLPEGTQTTQSTEKDEKGQGKSKHKKGMNLPRRASKRLAGIQIDPVPELTTRRRHAIRHSGGGEAITNEDKSPGSFPDGETKKFIALEGGPETKRKFNSPPNKMESPQSDQIKHSYGYLCTPEKLPEKTVEDHKSEHAKVLENGDKVDAKLDYSLDLPLGELLTDPCIAFAVQTLTGVTFETSKNTQISSEPSNSRYSETSAAANGHDTKIKRQNVGDWKPECNASSPPPKNLDMAEHAGSTETDNKANENSGSSESPFGISWMDPCIEFAVKTLTGTIPMAYDPNTEKCLQQQQQLCSSNTHSSLNNLCQIDYYSSQYNGTHNPVFKQQSYLDPAALSNPTSVGMGNSAGARLPQCGEERRRGFQR
ncbi:methyl-CpG-binding domain-containing protein 13-like isoform X2 [Senna tora]|uniref:Methyl-CpG-binding domain-containing protein 13-like isoform X2 n=1 Tax=Senna tora TaxID=362788 RepID=A0A834T123_9FABA|nr:methyl-CpG-binding domain-containing protein 13-like isoform X2 [Senna tora]